MLSREEENSFGEWQDKIIRETAKEKAERDKRNQEELANFLEGSKKSEIRTVDPKSGGEKGSKLAAFSLIPAEAIWALAEHYGKGMKKYAARNWERGYKWSLSLDALQRHLHQWLLGEKHDQETGTHHLIAVVWHAIALFIFEVRKLGTNDITNDREKNDTKGI